MNQPRKRSKKDAKLKSVQTSTPILGKLTGEKFPSFKRLSIIKAQCERDIREIQGLQENKRRKKKLLSISGIYKDTSEQLLEARQSIIKREESDSFTRIFYKRASIEQPSLLLSNENYGPFQKNRISSKECLFSLDDAEARGSKKTKRMASGSKTSLKSRNSLGEKIRSMVSSKSDRNKGRDYVGVLMDVSNFQGDVSDPEVVDEVLKDCVSKRSGGRSRIEVMKEDELNHSSQNENKATKKKRRISRTSNLTNGRVVRRKPKLDNFKEKEALEAVKMSSSGMESSEECIEERKSNQSDASEKERRSEKERKGSSRKPNLINGKVMKEESTSENTRNKEVLKVIGNACFGTRTSSQRTGRIENSCLDTDGKGNEKIMTLRKRKITNGLSGNKLSESGQGSEMNKSTPVNKRAGPKKGSLKKKLWNDPLIEKNLPLTFQDLDETEKTDEEEAETEEKTKTSCEMSSSNTPNNGFQGIMEESNEFLPPSSDRLKSGKDPKRVKNTTALLNREIFKKPPKERLLSKVLKKSVKAKHLLETSSDDKENDPYPSTSTPLDSPVSDCKSMPSLFHGLSPVLERPIGFTSIHEPSCVNITYSKATHAVKETKLDLLWHSLLDLESNNTFVKNTPLVEPEGKADGGSDDDGIRLFESPPRTLPPVGRSAMMGSCINHPDQSSCIDEEVEETPQHASKSRRKDKEESLESSRKSPVSKGVLEKLNRDLEELSEWQLCCESVPYSRHDHLLNQ